MIPFNYPVWSIYLILFCFIDAILFSAVSKLGFRTYIFIIIVQLGLITLYLTGAPVVVKICVSIWSAIITFIAVELSLTRSVDDNENNYNNYNPPTMTLQDFKNLPEPEQTIFIAKLLHAVKNSPEYFMFADSVVYNAALDGMFLNVKFVSEVYNESPVNELSY